MWPAITKWALVAKATIQSYYRFKFFRMQALKWCMTCRYSSLFCLTKINYFVLIFLCFLLFCVSDMFKRLYLCIQTGDLKSYSLMLNRGRSQKFSKFNIFFFLHIYVALLYKAYFLKGIRLKSFQYEMTAIFTKSLVHGTLFNIVVDRSNETHIIMHNLKT